MIRILSLCVVRALGHTHAGHAGQHVSHLQAISVESNGDVGSRLMRAHLDERGDAHQAEMLEIPMPSASDVAYKAMDITFGTTGMTEEDYPYACLCDAEGICSKDPAQTICKMRAGQPNGAARFGLQALPFIGLLAVIPLAA
ncbi:unnamed protein product [Effrenium voratum]|uniref:Uncharacterized protein n=2 Tax=Effrenium voratum TaxID=2562239 RepID=A0AA36MGP4_9DINO|nr:unnamed protein product [Effrenium voratum]